jgi:hypothetical protein
MEENSEQKKRSKPNPKYKKVVKPTMVQRLKQHLATISAEEFQKEIAEIEEALGIPKREVIHHHLKNDKLSIIDNIIKSKSFLIIFDDSEIDVDVYEMTPERINRILELAYQEAEKNKTELL